MAAEGQEERRAGSGLGIIGYDAYEFIVKDLERSRRFYTQMMDMPEVAQLDPKLAEERGEDAILFQAGKAACICISPRERDSRADRWLRRHPDGVAVVGLRVRDLDRTAQILEHRGATLCTAIQEHHSDQGQPYRFLEIATPIGDVRFRFVERGSQVLPPGFMPSTADSPGNHLRFQVIDHITSNLLTLKPHVSWLQDVLGFHEYWRVHFHTSDIYGDDSGSGLASRVMWDPESGIKLANNEPITPHYEASQIYSFVEANNGPGVQHLAFHVPEIIPAVEELRGAGIEFLETPATYYDMVPQRMAAQCVSCIEEELDDLRRLGILVDGADERYLLQIFMVEGGLLYEDRHAGPFFYEVIQRCGARGFGEGNFRALFEAIERDQQQRQSVRLQLEAGAGS